MTTVDFRTRFNGDVVDLDPATFLAREVPNLPMSRRTAAGRAATSLGLVPLTLDVDGEPLTFAVAEDGELSVRRGAGESLVVSVDDAAFSDLVQDVASAFWLQMTGRAEIRSGTSDAFIRWEPVLRCLLDGRPVYEPGSIELTDRNGRPLDVRQSFTLDDDHDEIGHFVAEAGFLHLERVFTTAEMAAVSAELDAAIAAAEREDGNSWWARTRADQWYPSRILGFNLSSPTLRELMHDERFTAIGTFTDDEFVQRDPDAGNSAEGLVKKVGVVEGISDLPWHKDCTPGGHSRRCCSLIVGISITGAGPDSGELGVVPGSHRANLAPLGVDGLDLARIALPTDTGDVTIHCACTLHMSRPPLSAERRVVYTGFDLAPRPGDKLSERSYEDILRDRASLNDHARNQQVRGKVSPLVGSYEL